MKVQGETKAERKKNYNAKHARKTAFLKKQGKMPDPTPEEDACVGVMGVIFGHNYQSRYDVREEKTPPARPLPDVDTNAPSDAVEFVKALGGTSKDSRYVHDVCIRCGRVIKRPQQAFQGTQGVNGE